MSEDSAFLINHELKKNGFATLAEAGALITQLAFCVRDHAHFRTLINACDPAHRREMYEALAPNVRFKANPLSDYLIESAQDAERRQLPVIGPGGQLLQYRPPEVRTSEEEKLSLRTAEAMAKEHLHVVCCVCTREETVHALTKEDVLSDLRKLGWRMGAKRVDESTDERVHVEVCPECVRNRAPRFVTA